MAPKFDEVDVFTIPHSRMKLLVRSCSEKVTVTDFTNNDAFMCLLNSLYGVFKEFKSHEEIENECIMRKLKSKLKERKIHNSAVCNCHNDDQFSPLIDLVDSGFVYINKHKTAGDRLNYGIKLRKALSNFIKNFVPHMKEEEEVFQPLLIEHFNQDELIEMKHLVIKLHLQQRKHNNSNDDIKISMTNNINKTNFNSLPNEVLLKIFSNLNQRELLMIARVSRKWNILCYDQLQWKHLSFNEWINTTNNKNNCSKNGIKDIEYIDESDEEFDDDYPISTNEIKILHNWIKYLLPRVGGYITRLDLNKCKSINNNLARRIFQLCPNLKTLDISYSSIGDNAFKGVKFDKLESINFEGCSKISDNTFKYIFIGTENSKNINYINVYMYAHLMSQFCYTNKRMKYAINCEECVKDKKNIDENIEEFNKNVNNDDKLKIIIDSNSELKYLNISGCYLITDLSLHYLVSKFNLKNISYLNLSGCPNLTTNGLNKFIVLCMNLNADGLFYCDNIINGPFDGAANGCENIECSKKFCCRNNNNYYYKNNNNLS